MRSQQQALSHLAGSVEQLASSAATNHRLTIEADVQRDKMVIDCKRDQSQKNRKHTIQMAKFLPMLWCTTTDHLCYLTGKSIQIPNSGVVWKSGFHNMLYFLLFPLLTDHRQHPTSSLRLSNQIMMQWSILTILTIINVKNIAKESKINHFSRDILLFYDF